jgi:ankyrin repeat protein
MKIPCSNCNQNLEIPEELTGQTIECPACKASLAVPAIAAPTPTTPRVEVATPQASAPQKPARKRKAAATPSVDSPNKSKAPILKWGIAAIAISLAVGLIIFSMTDSPEAALVKAANDGSIVVVRRELANGVDVNAQNEYGYTALMAAAVKGHKEIVELLLDKGANVNLKVTVDKQGFKVFSVTPLYIAALAGQTEVTEFLISKGARVNSMVTTKIKDLPGELTESILHETVKKGHIETVKLLLDKGASINKLASMPRPGNEYSIIKFTPIDVAVERENDEMIELLRKHGGETKTKLDEI